MSQNGNGELPKELQRINQLLTPKTPLSEEVLRKIELTKNRIVQNLQITVLSATSDIQKVKTLSASPAKIDPKTEKFAAKMLFVINDGIDMIKGLKEFLNFTLPCRIHIEEIRPRIDANPTKIDEIVAEYTGPENAERQALIKNQSLPFILEFMGSLDLKDVENIIS